MTTVLTTSSDDPLASSLPYPREQDFRNWVQTLVQNTKAAISDKGRSLSDRHNHYTLYVLAVLFFATGYRPVRDPFGLLRHLSLDHRLCLISDKVVVESRAFRLVGLPTLARTQLSHYLTYLAAFASKHSGDPETEPLTQALQALLANASEGLPLFFMADMKPIPVRSVTLASMQGVFGAQSDDVVQLPENFGRHWLATELGRTGVAYRDLEILLGHNEALEHPFGRFSLLSPLDQVLLTADRVEELLLNDGFEVLKPPIRTTSEADCLPAPADLRVFAGDTVAIRARAAKREARASQHASIVRRVSEDLKQRVDNRYIKAADIKNSIVRIEEIVHEEGGSLRWCQRLFYRWLERLRRRGVRVDAQRVLIVEPEPSPFRDDTLIQYEVACEARSRFERLPTLVIKAGSLDAALSPLGAPKAAGRKLSIPERAALCSVSLALLAGMGDAGLLARLFGKGFRVAQGSAGFTLWFEGDADFEARSEDEETQEPNLSWGADILTSCLLIGFKDKAVRLSCENYDKYQVFLQRVCEYLGMESVSPFEWLAHTSRSLAKIEQSGIVRSVCDGSLVQRGLSPLALGRLEQGIRGVLPESDTASDGVVESMVQHVAGSLHSAASGEESLSSYVTWLTAQLNTIQNGRPSDFELDERIDFSKHQSAYKGRLIALLEWRLGEKGRLNRLSLEALAIQRYAYRIATRGTQFKVDLAWETVRKHIRSITSQFLGHLNGGDFLYLDDVEYEEIYFKVLDRATDKARPARLVALREFHYCLMDEFHVDNVDWSAVLGMGDWPSLDAVLGIDANIVSDREYKEAIRLILESEIGSASDRMKYAALLIVGYRFGLRWSEAFLLERRDIRWGGLPGHVEVRIRPNLHRRVKTRASRRVIPLVGTFTEQEQNVLREVRDQSDQLGQKDPRTLLFNDGNEARVPIVRSKASYLVNRALKLASGDPDVRFHHLRHSFASVLLLMVVSSLNLLDRTVEARYGQIVAVRKVGQRDYAKLWRRKSSSATRIRTISQLMGHGALSSITAYFHFYMDLVRSSYNRPIAEGGLKALATFSGVSYPTMRKRMSRVEKRDLSGVHLLDLLAPAEIPEQFQVPLVADEGWEAQLLPEGGTGDSTISLVEVDSLVRRIHTAGGNVDSIQTAFELLNINSEAFVDAARYAEKLTSFKRFALLAPEEGVGNTTGFAFIEKADENTAFRVALATVQRRIDQLNGAELDVMHRAMSLAGRGYRFDRQYIRFGTEHDYALFRTGMRLIGLGEIEMEDEGLRPDHAVDETKCDENMWLSVIGDYSPQIMKHQIIVVRYPLNLKTNTAFFRLLFTVATKVRYEFATKHPA